MARYGKRKATAKADAKLIRAKEKHARAIAMRTAGATFAAIAKALGYADKAVVAKLIEREIRDIPEQEKQCHRALECERLDALLAASWPKAMKGETPSIMAAVAVCKRRASLLGLDAPTKTELTGPGGGPVEFLATAHDALIAALDRVASGERKGGTDPMPATEAGDRDFV